MKLNLTLNSSANLSTPEDFARMLRLLADLLDQAPAGVIATPVYDNNCVRVGMLTMEESHVAVLH